MKTCKDHFRETRTTRRYCRSSNRCNRNRRFVAQELGVPFIYVRPEPKNHGRKNQIEGFLDSGQNIVVVEDLISTGKSSLNAVNALKEAGARVIGMVAIFNYGFPIAEKILKKSSRTDHVERL